MGEIAQRSQEVTPGRAVAMPADAVSGTVSEVAAVLSMIERVARDPSVDIDRVERMMNMHRELRREEAERGFNAAMVAVQAKLPQIKREAYNEQTRSKYARLEHISAAVDPIIAEAGMSLSFGTETSPVEHHYRVVCDVRHGAHKERYYADIPIDGEGMKGTKNKTDTHAFGSTMSYGRRYLKLMIFDISLTNEDNDGNRRRDDRNEQKSAPVPKAAEPINHGRPVITEKQALDLRDLINERKASEREFLVWLKLSRIEDIPADVYAECVQAVREYGRQ